MNGLVKPMSGKCEAFTKPSSFKPKPKIMRPGADPNQDPMKPPANAEELDVRVATQEKHLRKRRKVPRHVGTSITAWQLLGKKCDPVHRRYLAFKPPQKGIGRHPRDN